MPIFRRSFGLGLRHNLRFSIEVEAELPGLRATANRLLGRRGKESAQTQSAQPQHPCGPMPALNRELPEEEIREAIAGVETWYHQIEVAPGIVTPGINPSASSLAAMEVPENLQGVRVLDVGARDGYFSFVAEARGAEVLAIDAVAPHLTGFDTAATLLGSSVEYRTMNVYDVAPEELGTFDAIFFLGVLYHLRDPMLALDRLWSVARPGAEAWIESHVIDRGFVDPETKEFRELSSVAPRLADVPVAQFYPQDELMGTAANWWGPNLTGLKAMVKSAGFEIERARLVGGRGLVVGRKVENGETNYFRDYDRRVVTG